MKFLNSTARKLVAIICSHGNYQEEIRNRGRDKKEGDPDCEGKDNRRIICEEKGERDEQD